MNLPDLPLTKTVDKALEKPASTVGEVLNGITLAIFSPLIKFNVRKEAEIENYKQQILNEVSKIPEDKLIEPPLNIIGPALEASKFYIEDDMLKEMFSKLIASSMNIDKAKTAHPSFIEIIKQLSPLDAKNLYLFAGRGTYPIANFRIVDKNKSGITIKANVFLNNPECSDLDLMAASISNLNRLGLIDISERQLTDKSSYNQFKEHQFYLKIKEILEITDPIQKQILMLPFATIDVIKYCELEIEHGLVQTTPLGNIFINACLVSKPN